MPTTTNRGGDVHESRPGGGGGHKPTGVVSPTGEQGAAAAAPQWGEYASGSMGEMAPLLFLTRPHAK